VDANGWELLVSIDEEAAAKVAVDGSFMLNTICSLRQQHPVRTTTIVNLIAMI